MSWPPSICCCSGATPSSISFSVCAIRSRADNNLYVVSWVENVRFCLETGRRWLQSGQTAYGSKVRFGSRLTASSIFARHRNPVDQSPDPACGAACGLRSLGPRSAPAGCGRKSGMTPYLTCCAAGSGCSAFFVLRYRRADRLQARRESNSVTAISTPTGSRRRQVRPWCGSRCCCI